MTMVLLPGPGMFKCRNCLKPINIGGHEIPQWGIIIVIETPYALCLVCEAAWRWRENKPYDHPMEAT